MPYSRISKHRTAIMGVAALMIFYFHVHPALLSGIPRLRALEQPLLDLLIPAVDVFLLVSSYGLAHRFARGSFSWRGYAVRRVVRLYPPLFVGNILYGLSLHAGARWIIASELLVAPLIYGFLPQLWFVPTILALSLAAPLYYFHVFAPARRKGRVTALSMLVVVGLGAALQSVVKAEWYYAIFRIPVFLLGFLWGDLAVRGESLSRRALVGLVGLMFAGAVGCVAESLGWLPSILPWQRFLLHLAIAPGLTAMLALLLDRLDRVAARAARAVMAALRFYGKMSLEFYCVQEAIFIALMHGEFSAPFRERIPIYLPCFVLSTLVAMLLHWACRRIAALSSSGK